MRFIYKITILFLLLGCVGQLSFADNDLGQIQALIDNGKINEALVITDELLSKDPSNLEARFLKGLLLTKMDQLAEAEKVFFQLTQDHPQLPEPYNNLAVVYAAQGKFDKAQEFLGKAINTHPTYATAHENLGDIYAKMASRAYNQALELDDANLSAREKLSLVNKLFSKPSSSPTSSEATQEVALAEKQPVAKVEPKTQVAAVKPVKEAIPVVAEQKPVTKTKAIEQPKPPASSQDDKIIETINAWADAWSAQDVDAYLSYYSEKFTPPKKLSRTEWQQQRRKRLAKPGFIKVEISSPKVMMHGDNHAEITFTQAYQSDNYSDRVKKMLLLRNENDRWLIAEERSGQ